MYLLTVFDTLIDYLMKARITFIILSGCLLFSSFSFLAVPDAVIENKLIQARLFLPDPKTGYYRGTRFDWAGVIPELEYRGHTYFGQWNPVNDPTLHDAIMGPVEEFTPLGYVDAKAGENFVKIGVGRLRKKEESVPYSFATNYVLTDGGTWTVNAKKERVEFTQQLRDEGGYAYIYKKTVKLVKGKPELMLEHSLRNIGSKVIETSTYNHNFFMIDQEPTNEHIRTVFPFHVSGEGKGFGTIVQANQNMLTYLRPVIKGDQVFSSGLQGFGESARDYDIKIENTKTKAGVRITSDRPLEKLVFWACPTTSCPEPYIKLSVKPGEETRWNVKYEFYTF